MLVSTTSVVRCISCSREVIGAHSCTELREVPMGDLEHAVFMQLRLEMIKQRARR